MYYGDEIGMRNTEIPPDRLQDHFERNVPGRGLGRDSSRTPMQWNAGDFAGFSSREPWLPVSSDFQVVNVEAEENENSSVLLFYRELLRLRHSHAALAQGRYQPVAMTGDLFAYVRSSPQNRLLIALNFGEKPSQLDLAAEGMQGRVVLSTHLDRAERSSGYDIALRANEGVIVELI